MVCLSLGWMVGLEEGVCLSGICNPWGVSVWGGGRFDSPHEDSGGEREIKVLAEGGSVPAHARGLELDEL